MLAEHGFCKKERKRQEQQTQSVSHPGTDSVVHEFEQDFQQIGFVLRPMSDSLVSAIQYQRYATSTTVVPSGRLCA